MTAPTLHFTRDEYSARIAGRDWGRARIGVEMDSYWFSVCAFAGLEAGLPDARSSDATGLANWRRVVKSPQELAHMRIPARLIETMHARILEVIEPGMRKCDLVAEIYDAGLRFDPAIGAGGDYPAIAPLPPSGAAAAAAHLTGMTRR